MRARTKPVAWSSIAKQLGVSESQCKEIHRQFLHWEEPQHDLMRPVDDTIDTLTAAVKVAWDACEAAPEGSGARIQAARLAVDASITRLNVMRQAGRATRSLQAPMVAQQLQRILGDFIELLRRHKVGDEAISEFLGVLDTELGQMTAIDSTARDALPAGA